MNFVRVWVNNRVTLLNLKKKKMIKVSKSNDDIKMSSSRRKADASFFEELQLLINDGSVEELALYIEKLNKANEELFEARRAALNALEDAILSKEALRKSDENFRLRLEQEVQE